ncbi:hypothetical protein AC24_1828 [Escherichia coli 8-415-05_S3_C2]|nr:hypothetical protein AC24_1828 [Escherichia coli 8-415-05_S3_C2]
MWRLLSYSALSWDGGNVTSKKIAKAACVQPLCNLRVNF